MLDDRTVKAHQQPEARQADRHRARQHGALALAAARPRRAALGDAYVILNIPDYTLKVMQHGAQVWTTSVVTGKPGMHATPLLTETMKYITVNPTWNVPPSIIYNEYLPALQQDPTVLQRMGLKLERNRDGSRAHLAAAGRSQRARPHPLQLPEQVPGLSARHAGQEPVRQGRARLQPWLHAGAESGSVRRGAARHRRCRTSTTRRSASAACTATSEIDLKFPTPIPVNITYQTAFVDDAGKLQIRKDVYGRDATMITLLKNSRGKDLENVVAHSQPSYSRPATTLPPGVAWPTMAALVRTVLLRAAVRRPRATAAGSGRPPAAQQRVFTR